MPTTTDRCPGAVPARLSYLGSDGDLVEAGAPAQLRAALTADDGATPVAGRRVNFRLRGVTARPTTDAAGIAAATLRIPPEKARGPAELSIWFDGDDAYQPCAVAARVLVYRQTSFVIWGGNPEGLRVGQRVCFWGKPWSAQVTGGDYGAGAAFKGHARAALPLAVCQPHARTAGAPPLDQGCWTAPAGKVYPPPLYAPALIAVAVATSIGRDGDLLYGNVAAVVLLDVDPDPPVGVDPCNPGYGTITAVLADGAGLFAPPAPSRLVVSLGATARVAPGAAVAYEIHARNIGAAPATSVIAGLTTPDGSAAEIPLPELAPQAAQLVAASWTAPAIPPRGAAEPQADYLTRLRAEDGRVLAASVELRWQDSAGAQGPAAAAAETRLEVPVLSLALRAPPAAQSGDTIAYLVDVDNGGAGLARAVRVELRLPDGAARSIDLPDLPAGEARTAPVAFPIPEAQPSAVLIAAASLTWGGAAGGAYGPLEATAATSVTHPNRPPEVDAGPDQVIALPASAALSATVLDDGLPLGGTLALTWSMASGPGAVIFAAPSSAATTAAFSAAGTYVLRLSADDGEHVTTDELTVVVEPAPAENRAPEVSAGPDLSITLPSPAALAGVVTDDGLPAGAPLTCRWTQVSGPARVGFADPAAPATSATFAAPGTYVLRLRADDTQLGAADEVTVTVAPPAGQRPAVSLQSPAAGAELRAPAQILGDVSGGAWRLERRPGGDPASTDPWTLIAAGAGPSAGAPLGTFDPTALMNGVHTLRLTAAAEGGEASAEIQVIARGAWKIGHLSVSWIDLDVPMPGLPVQIVRTYDSRDVRPGDFGAGWRVDVKDVRLERSGVLGDGWEQIRSGGWIPTYCLRPTRPRAVTITFPTGKVYRFEATTAPQCQQVYPIQTPRLAFTPASGTRGSLVPLDQADALVLPLGGGYVGPVQLVAQDTLEPIQPSLFRLTTEDGTEYVIHAREGVRSVRDRNGNTLTVGPGGVLHSSGRSVVFVRDAAGRIARMTDPGGSTWEYTYDAAGDLVSARDPVGNTTRYRYDAEHRLIAIEDPRGITPARNEYDDSGRLVAHVDAFGQRIVYAHDLAGRVEIVTDRLGHQTVLEHDERGNVVRATGPTGGVRSRIFDADDNLLSETDELGHTTTYTYDAAGNRLTATGPLGSTTRTTYNGFSQVLTETDPLGNVTRHAYDERGNRTSTTDPGGHVTTWTYDARGLPLTETDPLGGVTRYEYDGAGRVIAETDARGAVTRMTYDPSGRLLSAEITRTTSAGPERVVTVHQYDGLGRRVRTVWPDGSTEEIVYNAIGARAAVVDRGGGRTEHEYDAMGRLVRTTHPDGGVERFEHDAEGRRIAVTDPAGAVTRYRYDAAGRLVETTHPDGARTSRALDAAGRVIAETDERGHVTRHELDALGRRARHVDPLGHATAFERDAAGRLVGVVDPHGRRTRFELDACGRRTRVVHPDGRATTAQYDALGREIARTDAGGNVTRHAYDPLGNLVEVVDALGGVTRYTYDELGDHTSTTDALGRTTRFERDAAGRLLRRTLPLGMAEVLAYDGAGRTLRRTDFNGHTTTFTYDAMGRLTGKTYDPRLGQAPVRLTYTAAGDRATMEDGTGITAYTYDARRRLVARARPEGALTYERDAAGDVTAIRSSNDGGTLVEYAYDPLGRLIRVNDRRLSEGETTYALDAAGDVTVETLPNGVVRSSTYDAGRRLTRLEVARVDAQLAAWTYTYDAAGRRASAAAASGRTATFDHDAVHRLIRETITGAAPEAQGVITYRHDAVSNRLERASTVPALPSAAHAYDDNDRLIGQGWDDNGNATARGGRALRYDAEDRLVGAGPDLSFVYDGDGNRVARIEGGVMTRYLVDDQNPTGLPQVLEELVDGAVTRVLTYGRALIGQRRREGASEAVSFHVLGGCGGVRMLTDEAGAVTDAYEYDAFGDLLRRTGGTPNDRLFAAEPFDPALALVFLRARWLDPDLGRFLTMDPASGDLWMPVTLHRYLFGNASPVCFRDPTGRQAEATMPGQLSVLMVLSTLMVMAIMATRVKPIDLPRWRLRTVCDEELENCLENPWQPEERWPVWGKRKDCLACFLECRAFGFWPTYKCPT